MGGNKPGRPAPEAEATPAAAEFLRRRAEQALGKNAAEFVSLWSAAPPEVRDVLEASVQGPHAHAALLLYRSMGGAGLDPSLLAALLYGCGVRRTAAENGWPALMSLGQAVGAAAQLTSLGEADRARFAAAVATLTRGATGDTRWTATAILSKALAAHGAQGLGDIERLAAALAGKPRGEMVQRTSLTDVDETKDDSPFDPLSLDDTPQDHSRPVAFSEAKNDGLFQRYVESCGPTSIEVLRGDWDPVYAFDVRTREMGEGETKPDFQRDVLTAHDVDRRLRLQTKLAFNARSSGLSKEQVDAVLDCYLVGEPKGPLVDAAIAAMRAKTGGFPTDDELDILRHYDPVDFSHDHQIGFDNVLRYLNEVAGQPRGVTYELESLYAAAGQRAGKVQSPAFVRGHLARVVSSLDEGHGVLFSTSMPDHFWSMSATRVVAGRRQFFVHDVWSGISTWVDEHAVVDGSFTQFFLPGKKPSFVDLFFLPKEAPAVARSKPGRAHPS